MARHKRAGILRCFGNRAHEPREHLQAGLNDHLDDLVPAQCSLLMMLVTSAPALNYGIYLAMVFRCDRSIAQAKFPTVPSTWSPSLVDHLLAQAVICPS